MKLEELTIEAFSKKGHGKTRYNEKTLEVVSAVPGDKILAELVRRRKAYLKEVLSPSPLRVEPRCPHVGACGGCAMQQVAYQHQLEEKQKRIKELFPNSDIKPITGMDDPFHYRSKMEFSFSEDKEGHQYLGLMRPKSRGRVENLSECHISRKWFADLLSSVRTFWQESDLKAYHPNSDTGSLLTLTARGAHYTNSKQVILTVSGNPDYALERRHLRAFVQAAQIDENTSVFLIIRRIRRGVPTQFFEMHLAGPALYQEKLLGKTFSLSPQAFFQPNTIMAEKMFTRAIDALDLKGDETVLDLYCGIGTIGLLLAEKVKRVIGVELVKEAICDARLNIENMGLDNVEMHATDAGAFAKERGREYSPDILIVDPPRAGLDKGAIEFINTYLPKKILYISCNPTTQAENLSQLTSYRPTLIAPFDQFPHTPHVENVILLEKVL